MNFFICANDCTVIPETILAYGIMRNAKNRSNIYVYGVATVITEFISD